MAKGKEKQADPMRDDWGESSGRAEKAGRADASRRGQPGGRTSVAKITEISATPNKSFEETTHVGIARAHKTLRNIRSAWIKEQQVRFRDGEISDYQVNMLITFVIDD